MSNDQLILASILDPFKESGHCASNKTVSSSSKQYHKIYPVNCTAILEGDIGEIKSAALLLNHSRNSEGLLSLPSNKEVLFVC